MVWLVGWCWLVQRRVLGVRERNAEDTSARVAKQRVQLRRHQSGHAVALYRHDVRGLARVSIALRRAFASLLYTVFTILYLPASLKSLQSTSQFKARVKNLIMSRYASK